MPTIDDKDLEYLLEAVREWQRRRDDYIGRREGLTLREAASRYQEAGIAVCYAAEDIALNIEKAQQNAER